MTAVRRTVQIIGRTIVLATIVAACIALVPTPSVADDADRQTVHTASVLVPNTWTWSEHAPLEMAGMNAHVAKAVNGDERIEILFLVIDPFGVDLTDWKMGDILAPTLMDYLSTAGIRTKAMQVRRTTCDMGETDLSGRMVIYPQSGDRPRLVAGMACGYEETTRWAIALVKIESWYDRPLLLEKALRESNALIASFAFDS